MKWLLTLAISVALLTACNPADPSKEKELLSMIYEMCEKDSVDGTMNVGVSIGVLSNSMTVSCTMKMEDVDPPRLIK